MNVSIKFSDEYLSFRSEAIKERLKIEELLSKGNNIEFSQKISFKARNKELIESISDAISEIENEGLRQLTKA